DFARRLTGARVERMGRRAKYLLAELDSGETLLMHLGMSGSFSVWREERSATASYVHKKAEHAKHDHVVFEMEGATVTFNDPRRFGFMDLIPAGEIGQSRWLRELGPEPLGNSFSAASL